MDVPVYKHKTLIMSIIYRYGTSLQRYSPSSSPSSRVYDPCDMCDAANITESCNKCCRGVCDDNICSLKFPDRGETTFIVCATCVEEIDKKLIPLIDLGKLKLLKKHIRTNSTSRSPRSLSRSPRSLSISSTSTISSNEGSIYGGLTMGSSR
jgi:hypothetical protein